MRRVNVNFFKERRDFNYKGMRNKLKKPCVHVHCIEDVRVACKTEHNIRKLDYYRLTMD